MLRRISVALVGVLLIPASQLRAQESSAPAPKRERWQVTMEGERYVWDIGLVRLDGDSLVIRQSDSLARLLLAESQAQDLAENLEGLRAAVIRDVGDRPDVLRRGSL